MFLALSKHLDLAFAPLTWALLLLFAALALRARARWSLPLGLAGLLVLLVFSNQRVAQALARSAESGVRSTMRPEGTYDAAIVLGGCLDPEPTEATRTAQYNEASERLMAAYELLRSGNVRQVLLSGGSLDPRPGAAVEAQALAGQLELWGIEPGRIVVEERSRNTRENAVESARLVATHGWKSLLLVTSAAHLPRAQGCFRAVGLRPDAYPVDFRHAGAQAGLDLEPRAKALADSTDVLRELAGRVIYRAMGYSVAEATP